MMNLIYEGGYDRNKIVLIVLVIVIIGLVAGVVMTSSSAKKDCKIKITSDKEQFEGGKVSIKLTDLNNTPISKEIVNITITDKKGNEVVYDVVKTDSKGKAKLNLDLKKGKYIVNVTYGGNENYTGDNTSQKLKIKEEEIVSSQTESYDVGSYSSQSSTEEYRPAVDSGGVTREEADKYGWTYTPDHGGHYIGSRDHWDEEAGMYHD